MARRTRSHDNEEDRKVKLSAQSLKSLMPLFKYVLPYKKFFISGLVFITLSTLSTMTFPFLLKELIDSSHQQHQLKFFNSPGEIAIGMICLLALQTIISYGRIYCFTLAGEKALADLRATIFSKLIKMPMNFFANRRVGELNSRISTDGAQIQDLVTTTLAELLRGVLTMIIGVCLIFFISPKLTLLMLCIIPVIAIFAALFGKRIRGLSKKAQDKLADSNTVVQETLQGITNVKAFNNEQFEQNRYQSLLNQVVGLVINNAKSRGMFVSFLIFAMFGAITVVVWYGTVLMRSGELNFGDLTAFVVYTAFVGGTIAGFADLYAQLQKTIGATERVRDILDQETEFENVKENNNRDLLNGNITFKNVAFAYPSRPDIQVLKNVNFHINQGEIIALVGSSGAGKSTIASLLLKFYKHQTGDIFFDDKNINELDIQVLRSHFAIVPQDIFLFGGTIEENILYGNVDATKEQVIEAAKKANAHEFIEKFPERYQTVVGERGIQLSGGQRQRIAIARAILKNPKILILDEATSALDSESEAAVQIGLQNLMKGRTSIVIAHRLSTIRHADQIYVLENGEIIEQGKHEQLLLRDNGIYKNMIQIQNNSKEILS